MRSYATTLTLLTILTTALAKTDIAGCTSSEVIVNGGASLLWYVPGTGEICEFLDCGGGRAPPKTTVPGCAAYSGTASYSPSYLSGYGPGKTPAKTTATAPAATSGSASSSEGEASGSAVPTSEGGAPSSSHDSKLMTITHHASVPLSTGLPGNATGTGSAGGNNVTGTATPSSAGPLPTGAADAVNVKGALGLVFGAVAGLAML